MTWRALTRAPHAAGMRWTTWRVPVHYVVDDMASALAVYSLGPSCEKQTDLTMCLCWKQCSSSPVIRAMP